MERGALKGVVWGRTHAESGANQRRQGRQACLRDRGQRSSHHRKYLLAGGKQLGMVEEGGWAWREREAAETAETAMLGTWAYFSRSICSSLKQGRLAYQLLGL